MHKPSKVVKRRQPNTLLRTPPLPESTLETRLRKEQRKCQRLESAAATFHGVALGLTEILGGGGPVFNEGSVKSLQQRSLENSALFKLFVSESKNACGRAVTTLEGDKSSFEKKSKESKEDLFQKVKTTIETVTELLGPGAMTQENAPTPTNNNRKRSDDGEGGTDGSEDESSFEGFSDDERQGHNGTKSGQAKTLGGSLKRHSPGRRNNAQVLKFLDIEAIGPVGSSSSVDDSGSTGSLKDFIRD